MNNKLLKCVILLTWSFSVMAQRPVTSLAVATQSSTRIINGEPQSADKALDGTPGLNTFAETKQETKNWIQIDLRNVFKIEAISIFLALHDGYSVDLAMIKGSPRCVYKNNNTEYAITTLYGLKLREKKEPLPDSRYITLRRNMLSVKVHEIRVFGDCPDNYCGEDCMEYCFCSKPLSSLERMNASVACDDDCLPGWTGEKCNTSVCPERKFGYRCSFTCHCRFDCDPRTGECLGPDRECQVGWYGSSCQMLNTFPYKMYSYNANVTDGNINTCVPGPKSELFIITLPRPRMLNHVLITVRQESYEDIRLQLIPEERPNNCVKQPVEIGPCDGVKKVLFLCHEVDIEALDFRPLAGSICELEFLGCASRSFGPDCNFRCHCVADYCNNIDGTCTGDEGCLPGWRGISCNTSCPRGFYGNDCKQICDRCANNETCHHVTGECREPYEHEETSTEAEHTRALTTELNKDCNCTDGSLSLVCNSNINCSSTGKNDRKTGSATKDHKESDGLLHVILPVIGGLVAIGILCAIIIYWRKRKSLDLNRSESAVPVVLYDLPDQTPSNAGVAYEALSENRTGPAYDALSEQPSKTTYEALLDNRVGPTYEGLSEQRTGATYEALSEERKETTYSKISGANEVEIGSDSLNSVEQGSSYLNPVEHGSDYLQPRQSYMVPVSKSVAADYIEIID